MTCHSTKVGPDQLGPPARVGSTRIDSDRLESWKKKQKHQVKWNIETITHLKVQFRSKMDQIKKDSRRLSVSCCVVKPSFCILKYQFLSQALHAGNTWCMRQLCVYRELYGKIIVH